MILPEVSYYEIGLNNVIKNPNPGLRDFDGSKIRGLNFELFVLFNAGKQAPKRPPIPYEDLPEGGEGDGQDERSGGNDGF